MEEIMKVSKARAVVAVATVMIGAVIVGACAPAPVAPTPVPDIEFARTDATSVNIDVDEGLGFVGFVTGVQSQPIGSAISAEGTGSISSSDCAVPDPRFDRIGYAIWVVGTNPAVRLAFVEAACGQPITLDVPLHGYSPGDTIVVQTAPRSPEARNLKVTFSIRLSAPVFTPVSI